MSKHSNGKLTPQFTDAENVAADVARDISIEKPRRAAIDYHGEHSLARASEGVLRSEGYVRGPTLSGGGNTTGMNKRFSFEDHNVGARVRLSTKHVTVTLKSGNLQIGGHELALEHRARCLGHADL